MGASRGFGGLKSRVFLAEGSVMVRAMAMAMGIVHHDLVMKVSMKPRINLTSFQLTLALEDSQLEVPGPHIIAWMMDGWRKLKLCHMSSRIGTTSAGREIKTRTSETNRYLEANAFM